MILEQNTYVSNYASGNKGIISITGIHFPILKSEYLLNNGDAFDEKLIEYAVGIIPSYNYVYANILASNMNSSSVSF